MGAAPRGRGRTTRSRHAEMGKRLGAQILADGGRQRDQAIAGPAVRRPARALQLNLPALAARVDKLADADGATVAQLSGPNAKLMSGVGVCDGHCVR